MKVKFPLKMADDTQSRTIEELREHFDLASVLKYYDNGKLVDWLADHYYQEEAIKISALEPSSTDFKQQLCVILGAPYFESEGDEVDLAEISVRNKLLELLKKFISDDEILEEVASVDCIAFTQEDLENFLDRNIPDEESFKSICLCGERFTIPNVEYVVYFGVDNPKVDIPDGFADKEVSLLGVDLGVDSIVEQAEMSCDQIEAANLWCKAARLGECYYNNYRVIEGYEEETDKWKLKSVEWMLKSVEFGNAEAQLYLGGWYTTGHFVAKNPVEAYKWFLASAEQGDADAQFYLGIAYHDGDIIGFQVNVEQDYLEATKWMHMAAEQGHEKAQTLLGSYYLEKTEYYNKWAAVQWLRKVVVAPRNEDERKSFVRLLYDPSGEDKGNATNACDKLNYIYYGANKGDAMEWLGRFWNFHMSNDEIDYLEDDKWELMFPKAAAQGNLSQAKHLLKQLKQYLSIYDLTTDYQHAEEYMALLEKLLFDY